MVSEQGAARIPKLLVSSATPKTVPEVSTGNIFGQAD